MPLNSEQNNDHLNQENLLFKVSKSRSWIFVLALLISLSIHIAFPYAQDIHFELIEKAEDRSMIEFIAMPDDTDLLADIEDEPEQSDGENIERSKTEIDDQTDVNTSKKQMVDEELLVKSKQETIAETQDQKLENPVSAKNPKPKKSKKQFKEDDVEIPQKHIETAREKRNREWLEARKHERLTKIGSRSRFLKGKAKQSKHPKKVFKKPPAALKKGGKPNAAWVCGAKDKGFRAQIRAEKGIKKWISYATAVLATYPTVPELGKHFKRITYVRSRKKEYIGKLGPREFIMPKGFIEVDLASPNRGRLVLARADVRCLIGVKYIHKKLFPITLYRVPAQFYIGSKKVSQALINFTLKRNGYYKISAYDSNHRILAKFKRGRLKNHKMIAKNIDLHFFAAKAVQSFGKLFGLELIPQHKTKKK